MPFVSSLRQFAVLSLTILGLTACVSQVHPKADDTQTLPIQSASKQCADQTLAIGHTQVGKTTLFGTPYTIKDHTEQVGTLSARTWQTITLPAVSIPADGSNKGATWKACMMGKSFLL